MKEQLRSLGGGGQVRLVLDEPIATLVIDHPAAANALSGLMLAELADAVERLEAWPGACVVARGEGGRAFCAGADLRMVREQLASPEDGLAMCTFMQGLTQRLADLPQITLAAIEGAALGGGAELATAFDLRVMAADARIGFVQARLGLSPGWGGGVRLVRLVGPQAALDLLASARARSAQEAELLGLVDRVVRPGETEAQARAWARSFARWAPEAVRGAKRVVRAGRSLPPGDAYAETAEVFGGLWGGPANRAALRAHDKGRR